MESCVNNGDIRQSNHAQNIGKYVGGIAGWYELGEIISCENNGAVICAQKADNVGGIAGLTRGYTVGMNTTYNASAIKGCWNTGNISTSGSYAGGIVGANHYSSSDTADMYMNCYNLGDITGADYVGGIAGAVRNRRSTALTRVHTCYTFGKVECTDGTGNVGAVAGLANQTGMLGKNFWNTSKYSGTAVGSGTAGSANKGAAPDVFESGEIAWSLQSSQTETDDSGAKK